MQSDNDDWEPYDDSLAQAHPELSSEKLKIKYTDTGQCILALNMF